MLGRNRTRCGDKRALPGKARLTLMALLLVVPLILAGCVNQYPEKESAAAAPAPATPTATPAATATPTTTSPQPEQQTQRIVATSIVVVQIAEKLDLDLVGVPQSGIAKTPARYLGATEVGAPMQPDLEIVRSVDPDIILSPITLEADLRPQYEAARLDSYFVDLRTVEGMYSSIEVLGRMFDRRTEAQVLLDEYQEFLRRYEAGTHTAHPKVLLLMGLPGSYVVATESSYAGSLVKMAGGVNVYAGETEEFITANTEDMVARDPDIILRTAHALPAQVMEMFADEFATNDIWRHFRAVQEGKVYDLPSDKFGMSATFGYPEALDFLDTIL